METCLQKPNRCRNQPCSAFSMMFNDFLVSGAWVFPKVCPERGGGGGEVEGAQAGDFDEARRLVQVPEGHGGSCVTSSRAPKGFCRGAFVSLFKTLQRLLRSTWV